MPKKQTKSSTSTITNTQIGLATVAALLANAFALAALPVKKAVIPIKQISCNVEVISSQRPCRLPKSVVGFRAFQYRCPNGKVFDVSTSCRTSISVQQLAKQNCLKKSYCTAPRVAVPVKAVVATTTIITPSTTLKISTTTVPVAPPEAPYYGNGYIPYKSLTQPAL